MLKTYPKARFHQILLKPWTKSSHIFHNPYNIFFIFPVLEIGTLQNGLDVYLEGKAWVRN